MRYLLKSTYTDDDANIDRRRANIVVEAENQHDAISPALSNLELHGMVEEAVVAYVDTIEDINESHSWIAVSNNGQYHFEIEPFEASDPVTKEVIIEWAKAMLLSTNREAAKEAGYPEASDTAEQVLVCVLGRSFYRMIVEWSKFDLLDQLHTIALEGSKCKPYEKMTLEELAETVMTEIVEGVRDNYDEVVEETPFGMSAMVHDDEHVWFGKG